MKLFREIAVNKISRHFLCCVIELFSIESTDVRYDVFAVTRGSDDGWRVANLAVFEEKKCGNCMGVTL